MPIDIRSEVPASHIEEFITNEGIFRINVTLFIQVATLLQWKLIPCLQVLRVVHFEGARIGLKSAKEIAEYLLRLHKPKEVA